MKLSTEEVDNLFSRFWCAYPRKANKKDARKAFGAIKDIAAKLPMILKDISTRKGTAAWTDQGGRFIPYPATYLRGERWEDDIIDVPTKKATGSPLASGFPQDSDEYEKAVKEWRPVYKGGGYR